MKKLLTHFACRILGPDLGGRLVKSGDRRVVARLLVSCPWTVRRPARCRVADCVLA